jgi:diguanylate cyclase (GGDEF)-like protein/PAS domain S-box-containing protein
LRRGLKAAACVLLLGLSAATAAVAESAQSFTIGVLAHRGKDAALTAWQPTADYLTGAMPGRSFRVVALNHEEMAAAVAQRRVDFVLTNPEHYIVLEARHGVTRLATLQQSYQGKPLKEFGGLVFVRANRDDIRQFADLKGRRIAGVAINAFGGYQMQMFELMRHGIQPADIVPVFVGLPQDNVVEAVARGRADAGFIRAGVLEAMSAAGSIRLEDFRGIGLMPHAGYPFLASTPLYPEWPFSALPHLDDELATGVAVALLSQPRGGKVAQRGGYHGWAVPLSYNTVHDMMKALHAPPYDAPEALTVLDLVRKYDRHILVVLLLVLAVFGYFTRRFARLNRALGIQMGLVAERSQSLVTEVRTRERAERQLANENRVLGLLAEEVPLPGILDAIAEMSDPLWPDAGVAILIPEGDRFRIAAAHRLEHVPRTLLAEMPLAHDPDGPGALARLLGDSGQTCCCEPIRNARGETLGQLVLVLPGDWAPPQEELHPLATLAGMAIERARLAERMRLAAGVFQNALEGIVITDAFGRIIDVSPSFTHLTGYTREEAIGQAMSLLKSGRHDTEFYRDMWMQLLERGHWSGEIWNRTRDGHVIAEMLQIASIKDRQGRITHFVGTFSDITSLKDAQAHLEKLASFDSLTGLPNRGLLADRLRQALSQAQRRDHLLAICFLDLDGFKAVNDTHGHEAGDALLREVGRRLTATVRSGDTVARLGGDEFVLLLGDIKDVDELEGAMQRVLDTVAAPYELAERHVLISTSIGITLYPIDDGDPDTLLRHADQAMYSAKQAGRNRYHMFDTHYAAAHHERVMLRDRLRLALESQELRLHYQPRISLRARLVEGVEALLRWQHPERGLLEPDAFLPGTEHDEVMCDIGGWVLREALKQQQQWQEQGTALAIGVNIAARHFLAPQFIPALEGLLAEFPGFASGGLELEILESAAIEDTERMAAVIRQCQALGVRFALDDFGTGYSSLSYLQHLPADTLKIDRGFIHGMLASRSGLAMVEAIIGLAGAFDCDLVAEGVETLEEGELLARLGCGSGQGFAIARPMPADKVLPWIGQYRMPPSWACWSDGAFGAHDFPLVLAEFEHRGWIRHLIAATEGRPMNLSPDVIRDPTQCEFGKWLRDRGRDRYGRSPLFGEIDSMHRAVHELGHAIQSQVAAGKSEQARAEVPQLRERSDRLVAALARLQRAKIATETRP